jgi:hypothetical protein
MSDLKEKKYIVTVKASCLDDDFRNKHAVRFVRRLPNGDASYWFYGRELRRLRKS